jgi:ribonuclease HI
MAPHLLSEMHVYTDGTHKEGAVSWAILVLAQSTTGTFYRLGHLGGKVILHESCTRFLGAKAATSFTAEVSGLAWALAISLDFPAAVPATFHYDNVSAAMTTQMAWSSPDNEKLITTARVAHIVAASRRLLRYCHVRGHSGQPWNEYVDRVADSVNKGITRTSRASFFASATTTARCFRKQNRGRSAVSRRGSLSCPRS